MYEIRPIEVIFVIQYQLMRKLFITLSILACSVCSNAEKITLFLSDSTSCLFEKNKGLLDGEYKSYYKNGRLKSEGSFLQNNRFGFWVFYNADGSIHCTRDYKTNYSYEEKTAANILKKVNWNAGQEWCLIYEKEVIIKKRYLSTMLQSDNESLFAGEFMINKILQAVAASNTELFEDSRFVKRVDKDALFNKNIVGFRLKEDRILDQTTQCLQYRIIGIAPLEYSRELKTYKELAWIYYPDFKSNIRKITLNTPLKFATNLLDVFEMRIFASSSVPLMMPGTGISEEEPESLHKNMIYMIEKENSYILSDFKLQ